MKYYGAIAIFLLSVYELQSFPQPNSRSTVYKLYKRQIEFDPTAQPQQQHQPVAEPQAPGSGLPAAGSGAVPQQEPQPFQQPNPAVAPPPQPEGRSAEAAPAGDISEADIQQLMKAEEAKTGAGEPPETDPAALGAGPGAAPRSLDAPQDPSQAAPGGLPAPQDPLQGMPQPPQTPQDPSGAVPAPGAPEAPKGSDLELGVPVSTG